MKIIFAGIIGRYPWGGVTWCSLMYMIGLRQLGHDVYYLEDTSECNFDPEINAYATNPGYAIRYISECLRTFGFADKWCYVDYLGNYHGHEKENWKGVCESVDLLLVLSGGVWSWRDEYLAIPRKVFIDSDPGFTQIAIQQSIDRSTMDSAKHWYVDFFRQYDRLFTFGRNIGQPGCIVPTGGFEWLPTSQPVCMNLWQDLHPPRSGPWSTIMTWQIESFQDIGGNKDLEFQKVLDMPSRVRACDIEFQLAVNGPVKLLSEHGWQCVDAYSVTRNPAHYQQFIARSRGEFSVAKHTYVSTNCGWFSDRTACYLAAGRPAVVQDTGFTQWLDCDGGLLAWATADEAENCLRRTESDYASHCRAAQEVARNYFSSDILLKNLLERC